MKIKTENVCPPIPTQSHDWQAYDDDTYDGPGSPLGTGATEQEAIADLMEKVSAETNDYECPICGRAVASLSWCDSCESTMCEGCINRHESEGEGLIAEEE